MRKILLMVILMILTTSVLFSEYDFCDKTILVILEHNISHYTGTLDISFFGNIPLKSVKNVSEITSSKAIQIIEEMGYI